MKWLAQLVAAAVLTTPLAASAQSLTWAQARAVIAPWYSLFNHPVQGDMKTLQEQVLTADYESCWGYLPGECWGRDASIKVVGGFAKSIPDMKFEIKEALVAGDPRHRTGVGVGGMLDLDGEGAIALEDRHSGHGGASHRPGVSNRTRVISRETEARQEPGRGGGRAFSCERGRSHRHALPAPRRGLRHNELATGCRGRRDRASQWSVWERMGARQHPTRALAAFDRLLPWQMETAVFIPPMLATRREDPRRLADLRYIAEPKLDGQRAQLHVRGYRTAHAFLAGS